MAVRKCYSSAITGATRPSHTKPLESGMNGRLDRPRFDVAGGPPAVALAKVGAPPRAKRYGSHTARIAPATEGSRKRLKGLIGGSELCVASIDATRNPSAPSSPARWLAIRLVALAWPFPSILVARSFGHPSVILRSHIGE